MDNKRILLTGNLRFDLIDFIFYILYFIVICNNNEFYRQPRALSY